VNRLLSLTTVGSESSTYYLRRAVFSSRVSVHATCDL